MSKDTAYIRQNRHCQSEDEEDVLLFYIPQTNEQNTVKNQATIQHQEDAFKCNEKVELSNLVMRITGISKGMRYYKQVSIEMLLNVMMKKLDQIQTITQHGMIKGLHQNNCQNDQELLSIR